MNKSVSYLIIILFLLQHSFFLPVICCSFDLYFFLWQLQEKEKKPLFLQWQTTNPDVAFLSKVKFINSSHCDFPRKSQGHRISQRWTWLPFISPHCSSPWLFPIYPSRPSVLWWFQEMFLAVAGGLVPCSTQGQDENKKTICFQQLWSLKHW